MVQPVNHDFGSETATTVLGGLKGGLFYGILGTIASTVVGAGVGGLMLGGAAAIVAAVITPLAPAVPLVAGAGALVGGFFGLTYGGATSVIGGAIAGVFQGRTQIAREQGLANAIEREKAGGQAQVIASARGDAIEQGVTMGYMQGMQDGQGAIMNQLAAAQQPQAAPMAEHDCAPCKKAQEIIAKHEAKHHASHVEKVTANAAEPSLGQAV